MALLVGSAAADELMLDAPGTHAAKIPVSCDSYICDLGTLVRIAPTEVDMNETVEIRRVLYRPDRLADEYDRISGCNCDARTDALACH